MSTSNYTKGVHHIGLTIPNIATTKAFFIETLGFDQIGEVPEYPAVFLTDGTTMLTLWQVDNPDTAIAFDRKNVIGLHHFALTIGGNLTFEQMSKKLADADGVSVEFEPEPLGGGSTRHMMCTIPGGIRMEIIAPTTG